MSDMEKDFVLNKIRTGEYIVEDGLVCDSETGEVIVKYSDMFS